MHRTFQKKANGQGLSLESIPSNGLMLSTAEPEVLLELMWGLGFGSGCECGPGLEVGLF